MAVTFNKILIPVDFSLNTEIALKKAAGLVGPDEMVVHLLHVAKPGKTAKRQFKLWEAEKELEQWKETIRTTYPHLRVITHVLRGNSIQRLIIDCAKMLRPDLIIIGKQNSLRWWPFSRRLSPGAIAKKSDCPVLTVKPGSRDIRTKVIVIPIGDFLPERKLEWAVLLAKRYKAQIHLLSIREDDESKDRTSPQVFLKAYHHLREHLHHPIEYSSTGRNSAARAALKYAERIMADMILVNPETESGVGGFAGWRHISDLVGRDSKIQVLDVQPYHSSHL